MAYLLGSQSCMESLQSDVQDIQWTICDVVSHISPVQAQSWKFPDKLAWDLDIDDLLDLYDCSGDSDHAEERQIAHIALYELVIDRLVLLVQSLSNYCVKNLVNDQPNGKGQTDGQEVLFSSIGPVVKEHWIHMVSLQTVQQQLLSENISKHNTILGLEKVNKNLKSTTDADCTSYNDIEMAGVISKSSTTPQLVTPGTLGLIPPNTADLVLMGYNPIPTNDSHPISKDTYGKACQTYESAFVPCESCDVVQRKMREAGELVIKVCSDQSLPSMLKKFKSQVMHVEFLGFNDVCRWMGEQNKDIALIGKQIEIWQGMINPMKMDVKKSETRKRAAEDKAKLCMEEKEDQAILRKQIEGKIKHQERQHDELMVEEERQKAHLKKCKEKLQYEVKEVYQELEEQKKKMSALQSEKKRLRDELEAKVAMEERAKQLEMETERLRHQLTELSLQMDHSKKILAGEQGKNRSVSKHNEFLQAKQEDLLSRMEVLGQENENLSQQVASLEEEKTVIEDKLAGVKVEVKQLRKMSKENEIIIKNLESDKSVMEQKIQASEMSIVKLENQVKEAKERERVMIEYPDLNGPVNTDLQGSGDIAADMKNQVTANCIRIKVLENQNEGLNDSIMKLVSMQIHNQYQSYHPPVEPVPLWKQDAVYMSNHDNSKDHSNRVINYSSEQSFPPRETPGSAGCPKVKHAWTFTSNDRIADLGPQLAPQGEFIVGRTFTPASPRHKRMESPKATKPSSAKYSSVIAPVNSTPIGAYTQMKRALGILSTKETVRKGQGRPTSGRVHQASPHIGVTIPHGALGHVNSNTPFSCPKCDKMYLKSRDLDIHSTYCAR